MAQEFKDFLTYKKNKPTAREKITDKLKVIIGSEISNKMNITNTTSISLKNLIIGVESDILFPIDQQQDLANGFSKAKKNFKFEKLNSIQGHDSFLVDTKSFSKVIYDFFKD